MVILGLMTPSYRYLKLSVKERSQQFFVYSFKTLALYYIRL